MFKFLREWMYENLFSNNFSYQFDEEFLIPAKMELLEKMGVPQSELFKTDVIRERILLEKLENMGFDSSELENELYLKSKKKKKKKKSDEFKLTKHQLDITRYKLENYYPNKEKYEKSQKPIVDTLAKFRQEVNLGDIESFCQNIFALSDQKPSLNLDIPNITILVASRYSSLQRDQALGTISSHAYLNRLIDLQLASLLLIDDLAAYWFSLNSN